MISEAYLPVSDAESIEKLRYPAPWLSRTAFASFIASSFPSKVSVLILWMRRVEKRWKAARNEKIALNALVEEVLADLDPLAREKNIELSGNCENLTMEGSDILIYRLVYNLVENAIKYNQAGGQVTVTAAGKDRHIYLAVTDTGNGIPQELRERIFEPFFRVDKSRSRALGGVGLGLALAREIVRVHDGSISVRDNPAGGTVFEVIF